MPQGAVGAGALDQTTKLSTPGPWPPSSASVSDSPRARLAGDARRLPGFGVAGEERDGGAEVGQDERVAVRQRDLPTPEAAARTHVLGLRRAAQPEDRLALDQRDPSCTTTSWPRM